MHVGRGHVRVLDLGLVRFVETATLGTESHEREIPAEPAGGGPIGGHAAPVVVAEQLAQAVATMDTLLTIPRDDQPYRASSDDDGLRTWLAAYAPPELDEDTSREPRSDKHG